MSWPKEPFWDYSLALYTREGVAEACLELQRRHGLDVDLLLFACWLGSRGIVLDPAAAEQAREAVLAWQLEVVRPLRALRRRLGARLGNPKQESIHQLWADQAGTLRAGVKRLELDGEHLEQLALGRLGAAMTPAAEPGLPRAAANLASLFGFYPEDRTVLRRLLGAAFERAAPGTLEEALDRLTPLAG
jgi:uncharacterized protein (TIGR02444 family)